jgi:hypothetical protein
VASLLTIVVDKKSIYMKKRKFIGFMTVLSGLPGLAGFFHFFMGGLNFSLVMLIMLSAILFRGICGVVGGVLLWKGKRLGYQLSIIAWTYLVIVGLVSLYQLFGTDIFQSFEFSIDNKLFWSMLGKTIGKLIWGIPFIYILANQLINERAVKIAVQPSSQI